MTDALGKDPINREDLAKLFPDIFDTFSHTADGKYVYIVNLDSDYCYLSNEAVDYFGLDSNRVYGLVNLWGNLIADEDREAFFKDIKDLFEGRIEEHNLTYRILNKYDEYVTCSCRGRIIKDANGEMKFFVGNIVNHQRNDIVDPVTGLYNINYLFSKMDYFKENNIPYYMLMMGVKSFFEINSSYGYDFGNRVLREIANIYRSISEKGMIYRTEGTKIVFLFKNINDSSKEIENKYNQVAKRLKEEFRIDGRKLVLETCGVLLTSNNTEADINSVYNSALYSLDKVKREKLSCFMIVDDKIFSGNQHFLKKLNHIRNCIINDYEGFHIVYQPIFSAKTGKISGMEALLRWTDAVYGNVPPGEFIEWLEKDPLFYDLGKWILRKVLCDSRDIIEYNKDFIVNINLSYPQLQVVTFKKDVMDILEETGFHSENLELELTERCKLIEIDELSKVMKFFKSKGIKIALDDLGTGYSALDLMVKLPIDQIKIDRSLTTKINEDTSRQSLLKAITACAKELNKGICVEGMETGELAEFIKDNFFVTSMQGYFYSKPKSIEEVEEMLRMECQ